MDEPDDLPHPVDASDEGAAAAPRRKAWRPETDLEVAALLRRLARTPWLIGGRDDHLIAAARRNEAPLRSAAGRLGWVLIIESDLVRLRKHPPPRPAAWAADGPTAATCSWFFLLLAAAESMPPRVAIGALVTAARSAAAEAGLPSVNDIDERRAIVAALKLLDERGVVERLDGELDGYLHNEDAPVLLAVIHTRLAHVVANPGTLDPARDPHGWLEEVQREPDPARRMRRALIDDTCVHTATLDDTEAQWLSQRVRGDDGLPLAAAFGLALERRAEGAAFVVPDEGYRHNHELGPHPFPTPGTVGHAALLLCDHAAVHGSPDAGPGPGWRGLPHAAVITALTGFAGDHRSWKDEYVTNPAALADVVDALLTATNLVHHHPATTDPPQGRPADGEHMWWFAPATGRWDEEGSAVPKKGRHRPRQTPPAAISAADPPDGLFSTAPTSPGLGQ